MGLVQPFGEFLSQRVIALEEQLELEKLRPNLVASMISKGWDRVASPVRPVSIPRDTFVVGVGGATLGGSCKTSVAIAIAKHLAETEEGVYLAHSNRPDHDEVRLARSKLDTVRTVLGKNWQNRFRALATGLNEAGQKARWAVADGLLQTSPARLSFSVLAVDAYAPLGNNAPPPLGNRRYALESLLDACDIVVAVEDQGDKSATQAFDAFREECTSRNVEVMRATRTLAFEDVDPNVLRSMRLGLVTDLARPERFRRSLEKVGIFPVSHKRGTDHGRIFGMRSYTRVGKPLDRGTPDPTVEGWVCTEKCSFSVDEPYSPLFVAHESIEFSADFFQFLSTRRRQERGRAHSRVES